MQKKLKRPFLITLALFAVVIFMPHKVFAVEEAGTVGLNVAQLYSEEQPNKRGVLVVRRVEQGSAAAEAGILVGDIIVAVNGSPVSGHDSNEIGRAGLRGPAGGSVRLTVVKMGREPAEIVLTLRPYPPHLNPASDVFSYAIPGNWQMDPRYPFPLPWSPVIAYKGFEDLAFAPGFDDTSSPEYHSYLIFWWLEASKPLTAEGLQSNMVAYFRGLAEQRGRNNNFVPDLSKVSAEYHDSSQRPRTFGGAPAEGFSGSVTLYDRHGKVITLQSEITTSVCASTNHTAVFFAMSLAARPAALWTQLDTVRDGFQCSR
jgi:hypothetical protein